MNILKEQRIRETLVIVYSTQHIVYTKDKALRKMSQQLLHCFDVLVKNLVIFHLFAKWV